MKKIILLTVALCLAVSCSSRMRLAQFGLGLGAGGAYQLSPAHKADCSWYGEERRGKPMANGELFNPDLPIIASRDYDIDTVLELYYRGRRVRGVVLDRGPVGHKLDISEALFRELVGSTDAGVIEVEYKLVKFGDVAGSFRLN